MRMRSPSSASELLRKLFKVMSLTLHIIYVTLVALDIFIIYLEMRFTTFRNLLLFRLTLIINGLPADVRTALTSTYRNGLKAIKPDLKELLKVLK